MKTSLLALGLVMSFSAFADLQPVSDAELSVESAKLECRENEVLERVVVGRICVFRDPQYNNCIAWENIYRERCVSQASIEQ